MELSIGDVAAVVIYFLLIIGIGVWVSITFDIKGEKGAIKMILFILQNF